MTAFFPAPLLLLRVSAYAPTARPLGVPVGFAQGVRCDLPYPHQRNDCQSCRERDADLELLDDRLGPPGQLCQQCLGPYIA